MRTITSRSILILCTLFTQFLFAQNSTFGKISYEKAINLSGKQRMLSQKITKVVALKVAGAETPALKSELLAGRTLFERNLEILKANSISQSPKVRAMLRAEINEWKNFKEIIGSTITDFEKVLSASELLLQKSHNLVLAIEEESKFNKELSLSSSTDQLKVTTVNKAGKQRMLSQKMCLYYVSCRIFKKGKNADKACSNYKGLYAQINNTVNDLLVNELNTSEIEVAIANVLNNLDRINSRKKEFNDNRIPLQEMINLTNLLTNQFNKITNLYSL